MARKPSRSNNRQESDPYTAYMDALNRGETDEEYLEVLRRLSRAAIGQPVEEEETSGSERMFAKGGMVRGTRPVQKKGKKFSGSY